MQRRSYPMQRRRGIKMNILSTLKCNINQQSYLIVVVEEREKNKHKHATVFFSAFASKHK